MTKKEPVQDARMVVVACMVPPMVRQSIDALARVRMCDRSEWLRQAIAAKLTDEGVDLLQLTGGRA